MSAKNNTDFLTRLVVCYLRHYIVFFITVWLLCVVVLTAFDGGSSATCCNLKCCKAHFEVSGLVQNAFPTGTTLAAKSLVSKNFPKVPNKWKVLSEQLLPAPRGSYS
jgi:hypothetical protein